MFAESDENEETPKFQPFLTIFENSALKRKRVMMDWGCLQQTFLLQFFSF